MGVMSNSSWLALKASEGAKVSGITEGRGGNISIIDMLYVCYVRRIIYLFFRFFGFFAFSKKTDRRYAFLVILSSLLWNMVFGTGAGCSLHGIEGIIGIEGLVAIALLLLHCSSSNTFISSSRFLLARTLF